MSETSLRTSLYVAGAFNLGAALAFALPGGRLGQLLALPTSEQPLYPALVALFVALFGLTYLWVARQRVIHRPMLYLGALGKLSAFLMFLGFWISAAIPTLVFAVSIGDLAFAAYWLTWLGRGARTG